MQILASMLATQPSVQHRACPLLVNPQAGTVTSVAMAAMLLEPLLGEARESPLAFLCDSLMAAESWQGFESQPAAGFCSGAAAGFRRGLWREHAGAAVQGVLLQLNLAQAVLLLTEPEC